MTLLLRDGVFKAAFLIKRTLLILPFLNIWIVQCHKRKFVDFEHNVTDRKKFAKHLHKVNVRQQELIGSRCKPPSRFDSVIKSRFLVLNANAKDGLLAAGQVTFKNAYLLSTLTDATALCCVLLFALLG